MNDVILIVGSVTSAAYKGVRLNLLRLGVKPRIVRMSIEDALDTGSMALPDILAAVRCHEYGLLSKAEREFGEEWCHRRYPSTEMLKAFMKLRLGIDPSRIVIAISSATEGVWNCLEDLLPQAVEWDALPHLARRYEVQEDGVLEEV